MIRGAAAALVLLLLVLAPHGLAQVDRSEQQRLEGAIAEGQRLLQERRGEIEAITRALGATDAELRTRVAERDRIAERERGLAQDRQRILAGIAELEAAREATTARIGELEADLALMQERVRGLLVNLHRTRAGRIAGVLARADSFHDLRVKQRFVGQLAAQDVRIVNELDAVVTDLSEQRSLQERQIESLRDEQARLEANARELEAARAQLAGVIASLHATQDGQRAQQRALLEAQERLEAQLRTLDGALAREVARLREEERRLREEAQRFVQDRTRAATLEEQADQARARADALTAPAPVPASGYVAPLDASTVLTAFGVDRHSFISLRASAAGAAVRAVRGGSVIAVSDLGANEGHMVAVQHDEGLQTVYTNLRAPVVALYDRVDAGAVLGYLGGSSLLAPDVLRFYVRRNNVFVDPATVLGVR